MKNLTPAQTGVVAVMTGTLVAVIFLMFMAYMFLESTSAKIISDSKNPKITKVSLDADVVIPDVSGLYDYEVSNKYGRVLEPVKKGSSLEDPGGVKYKLGKITKISFTPRDGKFLIETDSGVILGGVPQTAPIAVGMDIKYWVEQSGGKYIQRICPDIGTLCFGL